jgi:hypothetical protein
LQKNEGCRLWGKIDVAKVQGNIQLAPGTAYEHNNRLLHDVTPLRNQKLDISHNLDELSFGQKYPGQVNPLKGQAFDQRRITKQNAQQRPGVLHSVSGAPLGNAYVICTYVEVHVLICKDVVL